MRIPKERADFMARKFRATLNRAAKDGLIHESFFYIGVEDEKGSHTIHFAVEVKSNSSECFDCHGKTYADGDRKNL